MGLFADRVTDPEGMTAAIVDALQANPADANDPAAIERHVEAAKEATQGPVKYYWRRILIGLAIGGALLGVGILLAVLSDSYAADQALKAADTKGYIAPASSLPAIATSVIALATAWSGALVGVVLNEKAT